LWCVSTIKPNIHFRRNRETTDGRWFKINNLPPNLKYPNSMRQMIDHVKLHKQPQQPQEQSRQQPQEQPQKQPQEQPQKQPQEQPRREQQHIDSLHQEQSRREQQHKEQLHLQDWQAIWEKQSQSNRQEESYGDEMV
jgi:hypothetical protein